MRWPDHVLGRRMIGSRAGRSKQADSVWRDNSCLDNYLPGGYVGSYDLETANFPPTFDAACPKREQRRSTAQREI